MIDDSMRLIIHRYSQLFFFMIVEYVYLHLCNLICIFTFTVAVTVSDASEDFHLLHTIVLH